MNHCENFKGLRIWIPESFTGEGVIVSQQDNDRYLSVLVQSGNVNPQWNELPIVDGAIPESVATIK